MIKKQSFATVFLTLCASTALSLYSSDRQFYRSPLGLSKLAAVTTAVLISTGLAGETDPQRLCRNWGPTAECDHAISRMGVTEMPMHDLCCYIRCLDTQKNLFYDICSDTNATLGMKDSLVVGDDRIEPYAKRIAQARPGCYRDFSLRKLECREPGDYVERCEHLRWSNDKCPWIKCVAQQAPNWFNLKTTSAHVGYWTAARLREIARACKEKEEKITGQLTKFVSEIFSRQDTKDDEAWEDLRDGL